MTETMTWRCTVCGINWPYRGQYNPCPCGESCMAISVATEDVLPANAAEQLAKTKRRERDERAELERQEAVLAQAAAERRVSAAAAALRYDADELWLECSPEALIAWASDAMC